MSARRKTESERFEEAMDECDRELQADLEAEFEEECADLDRAIAERRAKADALPTKCKFPYCGCDSPCPEPNPSAEETIRGGAQW